ncbi:MAG: hypothetical protein Q9223_004778 [Gallowayella weberi]
MARGHAKLHIKNEGQELSIRKHQSEVLESFTESGHSQEVQAPPSLPTNKIPKSRIAQQSPQVLPKSSASSRKRKRRQEKEEAEAGHLSPQVRNPPSSQQSRTSPPSCIAQVGLKKKRRKESASDIIERNTNPVEYWALIKRWPKGYFEQHNQVREYLKQNSWLEEPMEDSIQEIKYMEESSNLAQSETVRLKLEWLQQPKESRKEKCSIQKRTLHNIARG